MFAPVSTTRVDQPTRLVDERLGMIVQVTWRLQTRRVATLSLMSSLVLGCTAAHEPLANDPAPVGVSNVLVVDTHIDAPIRMQMAPELPGAFDLARARAGSLDVAFMSIYVPAGVDARGEGAAFADALIDQVDALISADSQGFSRATCVRDVRRNVDTGKVSLAFGMENGGPLAASATWSMDEAIEHFRARGVRYVTLTHSAPNAFADSSYAPERPHHGLSSAGKALVARLNEVGIMVDVSHVSDAAFWQVIEVSKVPVIASHSAARHFTPDFERNIADEMIVALAEKGGVVQVNFGSSFVTQVARDWTRQRDDAVTEVLAAKQLVRESTEARELAREYTVQHPFPYADIADVLDHIEHVIRLAGVEHVGLGSDFDGVGDTLPRGLKDVSAYPNLISGLRMRGYSADEIRMVAGENLLRVWSEVEAYATKRGNPPACASS